MTIRNLVFEGGGVWGIAYGGALSELEARGCLAGVHRVGGASAGAIVAALLAAGYDHAELAQIVRKTPFAEFRDDEWGLARDTVRLLTEFVWYKGERFRPWIKDLIHQKVASLSLAAGLPPPPANLTLAQLEAWQGDLERSSGRRLPRLYLVASNLSGQRREVYSAEDRTAANLPVHEAVRRSMSIPLYFQCARGEKPAPRKPRDVIVDGGLTWNYPVNLFDDTRYLSDPASGKTISYARHASHVFNAETLGFRLDTTQELQYNLHDWANEPVVIDTIVRYGWALATFVRSVANKLHLHKNDWARTVFIDVGPTIGFTDFGLSEADKDFLVQAGRDGVQRYFSWRDSPQGQAELAAIFAAMAAGT